MSLFRSLPTFQLLLEVPGRFRIVHCPEAASVAPGIVLGSEILFLPFKCVLFNNPCPAVDDHLKFDISHGLSSFLDHSGLASCRPKSMRVHRSAFVQSRYPMQSSRLYGSIGRPPVVILDRLVHRRSFFPAINPAKNFCRIRYRTSCSISGASMKANRRWYLGPTIRHELECQSLAIKPSPSKTLKTLA